MLTLIKKERSDLLKRGNSRGGSGTGVRKLLYFEVGLITIFGSYESYFYLCDMAYKNPQDQRDFAKRHYNSNKQDYKNRAINHNKMARIRNRKFVADYLSTHPCVDCGEDDIVVLEFDHVQGEKLGDISRIVNSFCWSMKKLSEEIAKCEVRCANCHRRITHKRRIKGS